MVKVLKGDELYASLTVGDQQLDYKGTRAGQHYFLVTVGDRNGTCSPEFRQLLRDGKLDSVSYSETEYQPVGADGKPRVDPVTGQEMPKRKSLTLGGYLTKEQRVKIMLGDKELIKVEAELVAIKKVAGKIAERTAYIDAGIGKEEMLSLMELA